MVGTSVPVNSIDWGVLYYILQYRFVFKASFYKIKMGRVIGQIGQVVHPSMGLCDKVLDEEYFLRVTLPSTTDEELSRILGEQVEFERVAVKYFRGKDCNHMPRLPAMDCLAVVRNLQKRGYQFEMEEIKVGASGQRCYEAITMERLEAIARGTAEPFYNLVEATNPDFNADLGDGQ